MSKKRRAPKTEEVVVDMTPMIDIVFQLLAFFMIVNNFEQTQADERVKLPSDALAKPPAGARPKQFTLNVGYVRNKDGSRARPEPVVFYAGEEIPPLKLGPKLATEARLYKQAKTDPKDVTVLMRIDKECPTGYFQELIKLAQEAGFEKFASAATQKAAP